PESTQFESLIAWDTHPDPGIRYFSGTATYRKRFQLDAAQAKGLIRLQLGEVKHIARQFRELLYVILQCVIRRLAFLSFYPVQQSSILAERPLRHRTALHRILPFSLLFLGGVKE
ncbi:MAG: hypothetical protein ABIK62_08195, partial [candidate division WOR-3 bacterium]